MDVPDASTDAGRLDGLEKLSTRELHDRAMRYAERHVDVKFFWSLLEAIPAAEAVSGNIREADFDIMSARNTVRDAVHSGDGELAEALRPLFVDYLSKHAEG